MKTNQCSRRQLIGGRLGLIVWLLGAATACGTAEPHSNASSPALDGDPGRVEVHRLNSTEYNATVQDLLGTKLQPANDSWRGGELAGFDNIASVLGVDEAQYDRYFEAAQALATEVLASNDLRAKLVNCPLSDPRCLQSTLAGAGLRLFRRPLTPDEVKTYRGVYDNARGLGDDESASLTLTLQALLSSAEFLYRVELDDNPNSSGAHLLGSYELASRLSYFLWSSAPDDGLLQLAADGSLTQPDTLSAVVDRMLEDPKAERLVTNFAGQWLGAREVPSHPAIAKFYQWTKPVALSASQEMLLYFGDFLASDRSWLEFPTADFNYIDGELTYLYGIPSGLTGSGTFERVEYHDDQRAGFFGLAGFLALSSYDRRTSPSRRGHWIASTLLCIDPPPPPPNVPKLAGDADGEGADASTLDIRQVLEEHRKNPVCAGCHALFDSYGLALEEYDAIGLYRSTYEGGTPVDATATLPPSASHPEGLAVQGLDGLSSAVAADPNFAACVAKKLLTYGLGRTLTPNDDAHLQRVQEKWLTPGQVPSLRRLVHALTESEAFRFRHGGT